MTLIKSISGIRGTIGGLPGDNLTPIDTVKFAAAYGVWLRQISKNKKPKVVVGRDARISGKMVSNLVCSTLTSLGIDVIDIDLSTTPTVEIAVIQEKADGGIIITASHNPKQYNALKLLNNFGEFLNSENAGKVLEIAEHETVEYSTVDELGKLEQGVGYIEKHIQEILKLDLVDVDAIKKAKLKAVVDAVNSTGGIAVPLLLASLGVECVPLYCEPNGEFPHNPEPLPENLGDLSKKVVSSQADLGIAVDPDVDRLALVSENGDMFGEEYTIVACADYVLQHTPGNTVSNLSSSRALRDLTEKYGQQYKASAVGEINVVEMMKQENAVIGGEGNGGVIYPALHHGRDALVGIALFLSYLAKKQVSCSELRDSYPNYYMSKQKLTLKQGDDTDALLSKMKERYSHEQLTTIDGVKIDFPDSWVHFRKSNTEPIIRVYTESNSKENADLLADRFVKELNELSKTFVL